jgi:enoyl-CoA hydratase/carnithine racemase
MPEHDAILFDLTDHIATITLNRPQKLNAVTSEMAKQVNAYVLDCNDDSMGLPKPARLLRRHSAIAETYHLRG